MKKIKDILESFKKQETIIEEKQLDNSLLNVLNENIKKFIPKNTQEFIIMEHITLDKSHWLNGKKASTCITIRINENSQYEVTSGTNVIKLSNEQYFTKLNQAITYAVRSTPGKTSLKSLDTDQLVEKFLLGVISIFENAENCIIAERMEYYNNKYLAENNIKDTETMQFLSVLKETHPWVSNLIDAHALVDGVSALLQLKDNGGAIEVQIRPAQYSKNHNI